ncbi:MULTISPECIES: FAD-dependent oxidoreductase [Symbiopectobacterium]|uniref:FAD-dependent oxidoreductase n=1 Tax=Symbiopectobacterium TaxID=801 RepID=UPI001A31628B|nr:MULTISPECIES: FAD-dependent oxidoreductase [Symbiopectobacterium]MBG6248180.1 FAD-dependent oxidoreductase [Candidatus Symbiopectobacterium sp. PLON1]MBT9430930.1 FAD-dependent oxidoreductase [Candidatus Symbiopectobacterium endolongispinus]
MSEEKFDAIVVGAVVAGCVAGYVMAQAGLDVLVIERGNSADSKNMTGVRVDALLREGNRVTGVQAGEDALGANVVILADGVNSLLGRSVGMVPPTSPHHYAVGVKELIALPASQIEDRFNLAPGEGAAWLFAGSPSNGLMGGGFLYTNKDSISLGLVCGLGDIAHASKSVPQMLEDFKQNPTIRPLIQGGELLEYSAHMVPEGGLEMVPSLVDDGVMIVGDAAGLCLNLGYTVRGMGLAIASAQAATNAAIAAKQRQDFSSSSLMEYKRTLEQSFVLRDMHHYRKVPAMMENPRMVADIMSDLFIIDGGPNVPVRAKIMKRAKQVGLINLLKDGIKGAKAL